MGLLAYLSLKLDAMRAHALIEEYRAEVLHETPLFLAEFDSVPSEVHSTLDDARDWCDDIAKTVGYGSCWDWSRDEDGVYVQFWTANLDDRPLHLTGGTVTEIRVQRPSDAEKATPTGEATPADLTIYRAAHPDAGITLGRYTTAAAAREHCEAEERRAWSNCSRPLFNWIEDEEDGVAELVTVTEDGETETVTGYVVTPLTVASAYDEEADE
jgi:hypothetical protein